MGKNMADNLRLKTLREVWTKFIINSSLCQAIIKCVSNIRHNKKYGNYRVVKAQDDIENGDTFGTISKSNKAPGKGRHILKVRARFKEFPPKYTYNPSRYIELEEFQKRDNA